MFAQGDVLVVDYLSANLKVVDAHGMAPSGVTTGLLDSFREHMLWNSTAAITSILLKPGNGPNFKAGPG